VGKPPLRVAGLKTSDSRAPTWTSDFYVIGVYDISIRSRWHIANELKRIAFLRSASTGPIAGPPCSVVKNTTIWLEVFDSPSLSSSPRASNC
jgi:hypothetical protein